jgi:hypothetical protein
MEAGKMDNSPQSCISFNLKACKENAHSDTTRAKSSNGAGRIGFNPDPILVFIAEKDMDVSSLVMDFYKMFNTCAYRHKVLRTRTKLL